MTALVHGWVILIIWIIWAIWASYIIWVLWAILGSEKALERERALLGPSLSSSRQLFPLSKELYIVHSFETFSFRFLCAYHGHTK